MSSTESPGAPRRRADFEHEVRVDDQAWIPLTDGARLSARVWLPADARERPVPAVLEYLPYRKGDVTAIDDSLRHPYLAGHGYAVVRVDIRGSGNSDGILADEYSHQELDDALEVIDWIASQPWCTGSVGMMGISWGGFNSLQVAARRPPQLKAIITACSTDDRYADDVHYLGGCLLGYYMLPWASVMLAFNARPPDPEVVGGRWRSMWLERLEANRLLVDPWLVHQRRDEYWRHGSICEDYAAIDCAVYLVGGWADAYTNAIFRMLEGLSCPRKALVGPWSHVWPEQGVPGPAVGFLQEAVRWWDHWLKGVDTGIMDEPMLRAWMQEAVTPRGFYSVRPGRWVTESSWPSPEVQERTYALAPDGLTESPVTGDRIDHSSELTVGIDAGAWCSYGHPGDLPIDQRAEDARSLSFTSPSLDEPIELLGQPRLQLRLGVDQPRAFLAARLCDVAPDGSSTLITRTVLNLCHLAGHGRPGALDPGRAYEVTLRLKACAYSVPAGHRLRVAVSTSYWPWIWPSPQRVTLSLETGESTLSLPVRPVRSDGSPSGLEGPPETSVPMPFEWLRRPAPELTIRRDVVHGRTELRMARSFWGARRLPGGLEYLDEDPVVFTVSDDDPLSARVECERHIELRRDAWSTSIDVHCSMTCDASCFHVTGQLDAYEGDARIFTNAYRHVIPRDHV